MNIFPASSHFCDPLSFSCLPSLDVSLSSWIFAAVIQRLTITPGCAIILSFRCYSPTSRHHSTSRCHLAFAAVIQQSPPLNDTLSLCVSLLLSNVSPPLTPCHHSATHCHLLFAATSRSALICCSLSSLVPPLWRSHLSTTRHHLRFAAVVFPSSASEFCVEPRRS